MIEWGPFGEKTQRKNKPGIDFKSIPGSFMAKVHEVDTILQESVMQQLFLDCIVPLILFVLFR